MKIGDVQIEGFRFHQHSLMYLHSTEGAQGVAEETNEVEGQESAKILMCHGCFPTFLLKRFIIKTIFQKSVGEMIHLCVHFTVYIKLNLDLCSLP